MLALAAITPRSDARHCDRGPVSPKGVRLTHTDCGAVAGSTVHAPGSYGVSRTTSARANNLVKVGSSTPATGTTRVRCVQAVYRYGSARSGSPVGGSGRTTSAPRSANMRPAIAPGAAVRSSTTMPSSSGVWLGAVVPGTGVSVLTTRRRPSRAEWRRRFPANPRQKRTLEGAYLVRVAVRGWGRARVRTRVGDRTRRVRWRRGSGAAGCVGGRTPRSG